MFVGGVAFGYFILIPPATKFLITFGSDIATPQIKIGNLIPPATKFLITFGSDIATPQIKIGNYISIVSRLLLAIGLAFEMPVVTTFLSRLGIITSKWLASKRKLAIIFTFILAAIITPTFDPINQSLVAVPLIILYEMSIWLAKLVQRREPREVTSLATPVS